MSGGVNRLGAGGRIDRSRPLSFVFDGRRYGGYAGDTLASALVANGVAAVGRSFKYHRPRGVFGAGYEDGGAIVQLLGENEQPNAFATRLRLAEGLAARAVNCWPSARFDVGALAQAFAPLLGAGFYYKTFMWPHWLLFEPAIRRAAGLGVVPAAASSDAEYESRYGHCDVLVVGAGAAGIAAALSAARSGARTWLVDDGLEPGARLLDDARTLDGAPAADWTARAMAELASLPEARVFADSTVWGYLEHNLLLMLERRPAGTGLRARNWKIRARKVVLATGAFERPIAFADNDLPGIMLASAARAYVNRYAALPGKRAIVFTNNDSAYDAAADLARAGAVVTVVDSRAAPRPRPVGIETIAGVVVARAHGGSQVEAATLARRDGSVVGVVDCDLIVVSGGWNPAIHLASQSRDKRAAWDATHATFVAAGESRRFRLVGAAAGAFDLASGLRRGAEAGAAAAAECGFAATPIELPRADDEAGSAIEPLWFVAPTYGRGKAFVDLVNDVTLADLAQAQREGYAHIEHTKRYTTAGMGIDQGKSANIVVIGAVATLTGRAPDEVGTTTFRQPYTPVEFGAVAGHRAGERLSPKRRTPMFDWHVARGAVMYESGLRWQRPGYYPRPSDTWQSAAEREARAVRERVGMYDGSPLGKFLVKGPDAATFLDRLYVNDFASLRPGRGRYGLMLSDDALYLDDGVTFRLDEAHWLVHTSTGAADRVYRHMESLLQVHWPDLRVALVPVTAAWANATVCGPRAREVVQAAGTDIDLATASLPFMAMAEGSVAGLPARVMRVSWTGEMSVEVNVRARDGMALWERLMAAGREFGIEPVGSEASHILRVEAGYISSGHEVDGTADPYDLGLGGMVSKTKRDFIGKKALDMRRRADPARRELVGLLPEDPAAILAEGTPITPRGERTDSEGFVSACVTSVTLERSIALGLLKDGRKRLGETVVARDKARIYALKVVEPVFYDPRRTKVKG